MKKPDIRTRFIRPSLDPAKLVHFLSVYETGVFSVAAAENGVTQQAVSKSIARLEDSLGVTLFDRSSFGARPTIFADALVKRARAIVAESKLAAAELSAMRGAGTGYVRIGLGWSLLPRIAPELIKRFKKQNPDVTLSIRSGDSRSLYQALLKGDIEFVASAPPSELPVDPTISRRAMFIDRDHLVVRADHPLADAASISLEAYQSQTWLISLQLSQQWRQICNVFLDRDMEPPENFVDLDSVMLLKSLLLSSDGVCLLSPELISLPHERGIYKSFEDHPFSSERTAQLAIRKDTELQLYARKLLATLDSVWRELIDESLHRKTSSTAVEYNR